MSFSSIPEFFILTAKEGGFPIQNYLHIFLSTDCECVSQFFFFFQKYVFSVILPCHYFHYPLAQVKILRKTRAEQSLKFKVSEISSPTKFTRRPNFALIDYSIFNWVVRLRSNKGTTCRIMFGVEADRLQIVFNSSVIHALGLHLFP